MVDVSASVSEASTQGFTSKTGAFNVGGGGGTNWLVLGLAALAVAGLVWFLKKRK
jgi:hypothetical protein